MMSRLIPRFLIPSATFFYEATSSWTHLNHVTFQTPLRPRNYSCASLPNEHHFSESFTKLVYQDDDYLAINKPSGLKIFGTCTTVPEAKDSSSCSLLQMLPQLSSNLNIPDLQIGLSLKSYYSGLVLLTKKKTSIENLRRCIATATSQKTCYLTYLAITVGKPRCKMNQDEEIYLSKEFLHDREMSLVYDKPVQSARKEGKMIQVVYNIKTVLSNQRTQSSLIEVSINKDKWDAIPVLLSHYLSPVLGDTIYSSRTNFLMGVPMHAAPHAAFPGMQRLPASTKRALLKKFDLDQAPLPLFVHRSRLTLPALSSKSSPIEITAALPHEFKMALECLGLSKTLKNIK